MASWFRRKKTVKVEDITKVEIKAIDYPAKIILAWAKAIEGNEQFRLWLKDNGYPELLMATYAIYLREEARDWLNSNGYPHLMAMIHAAEGNESAQNWLVRNGFEILYHIAMAVEDEQNSFVWLRTHTTQDIFILAQTIKKVKDNIEENHNDVHSFRKDI